MQTPPGGGHNPREAQELEARFSALSAEIAASLDMILTKLQSAPGDEHAIAVARDLVAAQQTINQQLLLLAQADSRFRIAATQPLPQLAAPAARASAISPASPDRNSQWPDISRQAPRTSLQNNPAPAARPQEAPTLADLLRHHLAVSAPQPAHHPNWPPNAPYQPRPARPHALELAPMTVPATDHVVWTHNVQPQFTGLPPSAPAPSATPPAAERFAPAPIAIPAAAMPAAAQPGLPAWAQPTVQPRIQRYGLWAGGAVAAVVVGLGIALHAGRQPDTTAPLETASIAAETADAEEPQPSDEPAPAETVAAVPEAEVPRMDGAAIAREATNVESPAAASPPPALVPPIAREVPPVPAQGTLLPSAQNWVDQNAPPERVTPPPAPKAKAPAARTDPRETGALGKSKPDARKKSEPTAAPKAAAKNAEVAPFKTAVVKAPQQTLFAPVLLELKNADSLMRVFEDLQRRHSALAGKRAELRPAAGPNNETWFALLAVPAVSKTEAEAICRAMGSEGATLRCRTIKY